MAAAHTHTVSQLPPSVTTGDDTDVVHVIRLCHIFPPLLVLDMGITHCGHRLRVSSLTFFYGAISGRPRAVKIARDNMKLVARNLSSAEGKLHYSCVGKIVCTCN